MAGSIGCEGLRVAGAGGDSVIRVIEAPIQESVSFPESQGISESLSQSVSVIVT